VWLCLHCVVVSRIHCTTAGVCVSCGAEEEPVTVSFGAPIPAPHAPGCPVKGIFSLDVAPGQALEVRWEKGRK
jgi:hypothetical protein